MKKYLSILLNSVLIVSELLLALSAFGTDQMKYFTVISNLYMGAAALLYLMCMQAQLCGVIPRVPRAVIAIRYSAVSALTLTFSFTCAYILPLRGAEIAFGGNQLQNHLILPLIAIIDYLFLSTERVLRPAQRILAVLPCLLYCGFYLGNLIVNGYGGTGHPNDWYRFGVHSPLGVFAVLAAVIAAGWIIAFLIYLPHAEKAAQETKKK